MTIPTFRGLRTAVPRRLRLLSVVATALLTSATLIVSPIAPASAASRHIYRTSTYCRLVDGNQLRVCMWFDYYIVKVDDFGANRIHQSAHATLSGSRNKTLSVELRYRNPRVSAHSKLALRTPSTGGYGVLSRHIGYIGCNEFDEYRVAVVYRYFAPKPTNAWVQSAAYGPYVKFQGAHHGTCGQGWDPTPGKG